MRKTKFIRRLQVLMMPGLGGAKRGKELRSNGAMNAARPDTPHRGQDGDNRSKQFTVVQRGKTRMGEGSFSTQSPTRSRLAVISRAKLSKTFPSYSRRLAGNSFGGKAYKHSSMFVFSVWRCCWCHRGLVRGGRKDRLRGCCHPLSCQSSHSSPRAPQTPLGPKAGDVVKSINCHQSWGFNHLSSPPVFRLNQVALQLAS